MNSFIYLVLAIAAEIVATSSLKASEGFSKLVPSLIVVAGYAVAFSFLSLALKSISVGTAYAIWSGIGTVGIVLVGIFFFKEEFSLLQFLGILLIVGGVVLLNLTGEAHA